MSKYLLIGFIILPMLSLGQKRPVAPAAKPKSVVKSSVQKTLTITTPCAVLYSPDDAWIERHKNSDSTGFYAVANDIMYYVSQTSEYLNKRKIKTIDTHASTLRFVLANSSVKVFDLRNSTYGWGLILFNGRNTPKEADLVEPAASVKAVFGR
jgi:hypothetical protein